MRESVQNEVNECDVYNFRLFFKRTRDVNITTLSLVSTSAEYEVNECDVYNFRLFFKRTRDVNIITLSLVSTSAE